SNTKNDGSALPDKGELELDRVERLDARACVVPKGAHETKGFAVEAEDFDGAGDRVGEPHVTDLFARVDGQLVGPVHRFGRRRKDLANPVRRKRETDD